MKQNRVRIIVEVEDQRRCLFHLPARAVDQSQNPDIEPKHWFLRKLETTYERIRGAIENADRGMLRRLKQLVHYLESKTGPEEVLMKQLRKADGVELVYPPHHQEKWVRRLFRRFIRRQIFYHQRWLIVNFLLLPVTAAMTIVPGPNVFFGWNAFRLVSHYLAREGGKRVRQGQCDIRFVPDENLARTADNQDILA